MWGEAKKGFPELTLKHKEKGIVFSVPRRAYTKSWVGRKLIPMRGQSAATEDALRGLVCDGSHQASHQAK